jgi:hypothetical protein
MTQRKDLRVWAGLMVILLAAALYLATLDTGLRPDELTGGDLITHQYAQVQARPSNAPGYPLYTMGGWLWFRLTHPTLGWALNPVQRLSSYSTLWALLSLLVLYQLILGATRGNWPIAALSTAFYATTYFFWFYSVTTEQYTSAVFQTLLIVWLAFKWDDAQTQVEPSDRYILLMAFVIGTCLANLVTTLFILPPLLWFVLSRQPDLVRRPKLVVGSALLALLPLISYAYVYASGAAHPEWRGEGEWHNAWAWFVDFLTTQQGRDELVPGLSLSQFFTDEYPALIWGELTWIVLVGGLVGLWWLSRRRAFFLYGTLVIYLLFCWIDRFGNWFQVIIPAYPLFVLGFGSGLNALWSRDWKSQGWKLAVRGLVLLGLAVLVIYRFALSLPRADQSQRAEDTGLDPGWAVLTDQPLADSIVVGEHRQWLALKYLTDIWGAEPPVQAQPLCPPYLADLSEGTQVSPQVPAVYITRQAAAVDPGCLLNLHRYGAGAEIIRIKPSPNYQVPESAQPAGVEFGPQLTLLGFEIQSSPCESPPRYSERKNVVAETTCWHISLYWRATASMDADYTVSVRPLRGGGSISDENGQQLLQDHQPVWNTYPTSLWSPGEVIRDDYVICPPSEVLPDGAQVVVYRSTPSGFENLGEAQFDLASERQE